VRAPSAHLANLDLNLLVSLRELLRERNVTRAAARMAALLAFFPIMLNVMLGVRSVDSGHRDVMRGLGAGRWATFRNMELPTTLPYVFAGAEVAIVFSVIGAIVGEYLGGSEGLGYLVVSSLNALDAPRLFAVIVLLAVLGSLLYVAVTTVKKLVIPWHDSVRTSV
jgi:NitT/TauT family transport system permease protein